MAARRKPYVLGIDVGGTKLLTALLDSSFRTRAQKKLKVDVNKGEKYFFKILVESIEAVLDDAGVSMKQVAAIGMGCPGMIENGVVKLSPNIAFLRNYPLRASLRKKFGVPVAVENDANAGLYGEQQFGSARGAQHVAGIFMGTGVGGALILDGKIYRGASGGAGEIGHTFLSLPSFVLSPEKEFTLEALTGRLRIASDAGLLVMRAKAPNLFKAVEYDIKKIKSNTLAKAVAAGDTALRDLIVQKSKLVGIAMANIVNILNPSLIVLGGGVVEALGDIIIPAARQTMMTYAMGPLAARVKVVPAKLGDDAIFKGAARLAVDGLKTK